MCNICLEETICGNQEIQYFGAKSNQVSAFLMSLEMSLRLFGEEKTFLDFGKKGLDFLCTVYYLFFRPFLRNLPKKTARQFCNRNNIISLEK